MHSTQPAYSVYFKLIQFIIFSFIGIASATASTDNVRFKKLDIESGLSQQSVAAIYQDSKGFMWFGTQEGLNRYDGVSFTVYSIDFKNPYSISSPWIHSITEDKHGNIWVGTKNGVSVLDISTQRFTRYLANDADNTINHKTARVVFRDSNDTMWVATSRGLNKYLQNENKFKRFDFVNGNGSSIDVFAVTEDSSGMLWLGTDGYGLAVFDPTKEQLTFVADSMNNPQSAKGVRVRSLYIDDQQMLWVGTNGSGVYKVDLNQSYSDNSPLNAETFSNISTSIVAAMATDNQNTLWIGSSDGLYYKTVNSKGKFSKLIAGFETNYGIHNARIQSLYQDRSGVFWVGTFTGLNKWNTRTTQFDHYLVGNYTDGPTVNNITAIGQGLGEKILISSYRGLHSVDTNTLEQTPIPLKTQEKDGLLSQAVMSILKVSDNEIWLGYRRSGLTKYNPTANTFTHYVHDRDNEKSIAANGITSIIKARNGTLWFATFGGGISRYNAQTNDFTSFQYNPNDVATLSSNKIISLFETSDEKLWVGTWDAGVNLFVPEFETAYRISTNPDALDSIGNNIVLSIFEDSQNNIWLATHGIGANVLRNENFEAGKLEFESFYFETGMPSNVVHSILEDDSAYLWMSTNNGLVKLDPKTQEIDVFKVSHGLQGNEYNSGAYFKDNKGYLYFGGLNGVTRFLPENIKPNPVIPNVELTAFQRLNTFTPLASVLNDDGEIEVNYTDKLIGLEFAALDFSSPKDNQYKYKLEGFDDQWVEVSGNRRATYTNLPAGEYLFRVLASNSDGIWNEKGTTVPIIVLPAPWFSWWAYTFYTLTSLLLLLFAYKAYRRREFSRTQYQIKLESEVNYRTAQLSQANSQLLQASITDQLTGLFNRRYLAQVIDQHIAAIESEFSRAQFEQSNGAQTSGPRLMFLMFDLDNFKPINDSFGHDSGDIVIEQVSNILKQVCRKGDIIVRWGGDEFLVVAKVEDVEQAKALAERIRLAISNCRFNADASHTIHLSSSVGFALYPFNHHQVQALDWKQIHLLADSALYMSKAAGRNTWTGIVQTEKKIPQERLETLVPNIKQAASDNYVQVLARE